MKLRTLGLTVLLAGVLGGCTTLAPHYARPPPPVGAASPPPAGAG